MAPTPRRHVVSPPLRCSQRSLLEADAYSAIDAALKQLKACSKKLQSAMTAHRTELQVLERLYYKGKNQHRTALFWQRVAEMRKFGGRLDEMHIDDVVESLRLSFWGEPIARTNKVLRGPWTHCPDARALLFVLDRCNACCMLLATVEERLLGAYESFVLMMQTGAFLQLILVLVAIASRLRVLVSEVKGVLQTSWSAGFGVLQTLFPVEAKKVPPLMKTAKTELPLSRTTTPLTSKATSMLPTPADFHSEDLGDCLERTASVTIEQSLDLNPSTITSTTMAAELDTAAFSLQNELQLPTVELQTSQLVTTEVSLPTSQIKRKKADADNSKPVKKKKKRRDEIDDIFGF